MQFSLKYLVIVSLLFLPLGATHDDEIIYVEYNDWIVYKTEYGRIFAAKQCFYGDVKPFYFAIQEGEACFNEAAQNLWQMMEHCYCKKLK